MTKKKTTKKSAKISHSLVPAQRIETAILQLRNHRVMLDAELAALYGVETRVLVQAVKRNQNRFPPEFMFQLSQEEFENWRSQIVMSNPSAKMSLRRRPYAFTEHGILMLSSVLRSETAVQVNIEIMKTFVRLREVLATHKDLARKLNDMENKYDHQFKVVFDAIRELMAPPPVPEKPPIGFQAPRKGKKK